MNLTRQDLLSRFKSPQSPQTVPVRHERHKRNLLQTRQRIEEVQERLAAQRDGLWQEE